MTTASHIENAEPTESNRYANTRGSETKIEHSAVKYNSLNIFKKKFRMQKTVGDYSEKNASVLPLTITKSLYSSSFSSFSCYACALSSLADYCQRQHLCISKFIQQCPSWTVSALRWKKKKKHSEIHTQIDLGLAHFFGHFAMHHSYFIV